MKMVVLTFSFLLLLSGCTQSTPVSNSNNTLPSGQVVLSQAQLLSMASSPDVLLPLGDNHYTTSGPLQGYVFLCNASLPGRGGAQSSPWIVDDKWNASSKPFLNATVYWPNARFSVNISGNYRILSGNGLPVGYPTGVFPITPNDSVYQYDHNPNSIKPINFTFNLPLNPVYSSTPYCMPDPHVGVMLSGVSLLNALDADYRDAAAHEIQDGCNAHPQENGQYHYHSLSSCFTNISETHVLGFAMDGFPITGPEVAPGKYLFTKNLDECHGITSQIFLDNKSVITNHYVMTLDFPYSANCFRGKPVLTNQGSGSPPSAAATACAGFRIGTSCSFKSPAGSVLGTCKQVLGEIACVPNK